MKKVILTIAVVLASMSANAQLIVKEAAKDSVVWQASKLYSVPKIIKFTIDSVNMYTIYYRNAKYTQISDIDYISLGDRETSIQFFDICKSVLDTGNEYNVELEGKSIRISKGAMGTIMIWTSSSYFYLSNKQVLSIIDTL